MFTPETFKHLNGARPHFAYQRVITTGPRGYYFYKIPHGYSYFFRKIFSQWAEVDVAGANFAPDIYFDFSTPAIGTPTSTPRDVILRLFSTPNSTGVQLSATGEVTATAPKFTKLFNYLLPSSSNIEIVITGQNTALPLPPWVDVTCMGYLIPDKSIATWGEGGD